MKMTRLTRIGMAALGVGLLAWVGLMLLTTGDTKTGPAVVDEGKCPECGRDLPRSVRDAGGECPFCKLEGKSVDVGKARAGPSLLRGPTIPFAVGGAFVLLLLVHAVFLVRHRAGSQKEEVIYYINCRKCGRRLRYRERQAGRIAKCPLCQTVVLFPKPQEVPRGRWPRLLLGKILKR
jgi:hypothetical protein